MSGVTTIANNSTGSLNLTGTITTGSGAGNALTFNNLSGGVLNISGTVTGPTAAAVTINSSSTANDINSVLATTLTLSGGRLHPYRGDHG